MACMNGKWPFKYMQYISFFLFITGLFITHCMNSQVLFPESKKSVAFSSPLDIPLFLSSNYGEYRSGHFHAGVDFKTQQVEGKNVLAVDSGYVYRIVVLTGSYGKALYLKHPSGNITLYGHLSKFEQAVDRYVREQQYRQKSYAVDLYPDRDMFIFPKGAFIGLSGNSGTSFGAHLHFEIRDKSGAIPLNPLNYGFRVKDTTRPEIRWLMIYPVDSGSSVNGYQRNLPLKVSGRSSPLYVSPDTFLVSGKIGIGIETYDFLDNTSNQCGPSTIEVLMDNKQLFFCRFDSIPFSAGGYINSHFDYGEMLRSGRKIQKLYIDPNNKLDIYKVALNRGIIDLRDSAIHNISVIVKDTYGNESILKFNLRKIALAVNPSANPRPAALNRFYFDRLNTFENAHIRIAIHEKSLFDHIDFQYEETKNDSFAYSLVHKVHSRYTPLLKPYVLSIRAEDLPASLADKAFIAIRGTKGAWNYLGGEYSKGFITTRVKVFGEFTVGIDTIPPEFRPLQFTARERYTAGQVFSFNMADSVSGVRNYQGYIDKNWALFEYDAKNNLLTYTIDSTRLTKGVLHDLEIVVTDNRNNITRFKSSFYY
jgi:hypothetical protein